MFARKIKDNVRTLVKQVKRLQETNEAQQQQIDDLLELNAKLAKKMANIYDNIDTKFDEFREFYTSDFKEFREDMVKDANEKKIKEEIKRSKVPYIDVVGEVDDPKKGIGIQLDWNDAFVDHLKENGYTGTDEEIIQRYLSMLSVQLSSDVGDIEYE
jgi:hypothetical protein